MDRGRELGVKSLTESKGILLFFPVCLTAFVRAENGQAFRAFIGAAHKGEWVWIRSTPCRAAMKAGRIRRVDEGKNHEIRNG